MSEEHVFVTVECESEGCSEPDLATVIEHAPDSKQSEFILEGIQTVVDDHRDETGHDVEKTVDTVDPDEGQQRYDEYVAEKDQEAMADV